MSLPKSTNCESQESPQTEQANSELDTLLFECENVIKLEDVDKINNFQLGY